MGRITPKVENRALVKKKKSISSLYSHLRDISFVVSSFLDILKPLFYFVLSDVIDVLDLPELTTDENKNENMFSESKCVQIRKTEVWNRKRNRGTKVKTLRPPPTLSAKKRKIRFFSYLTVYFLVSSSI